MAPMRPSPLMLLGEANDPTGVIVWSLVVAALLGAGFAGISYWRKWYAQTPDQAAGSGFTLADLRELRRQGKMTEEEFEAAKAQVVAAAQKAASRPKVAAKPATPVDFQQKLPPDPQQGDNSTPGM